MKEAAPKLQRVAMLWNAKDLGMTTRYEASAAAAKELGVAVLSFGVGEPNDFGGAFEAMEHDKPEGLLMVADALTFSIESASSTSPRSTACPRSTRRVPSPGTVA